MNKIAQQLSLIVALSVVSSGTYAANEQLSKPQTMEEMWEVIKAQQQQIDAMSKKMEAAVTSKKNSEVSALDHKTNVLAEEVEKIRTEMFIPEDIEYKSAYGLGPAASKVYQVGKGLSVGGYGEFNYQSFVDNQASNQKDNADFERLVLYVGYKFTDNILFNSEIEFEHGSTSEGGSVSVEFAALDFFIDPLANVHAGMVLMPMGFVNQIHEPPFYFGNNRPEVKRAIIPSTWREIGVGLFGELLPRLTYTTYVVNGMDAKGFSSSGVRGSRQKGSKARAEDLAFVGRVDYAPAQLPGLAFGASAYLGNSGQNQNFDGQQVDAFTQLYEAQMNRNFNAPFPVMRRI